MCEKTCGDCHEFFENFEQCGHPMVYLNHSDNTHHTTATTKACGYFEQKTEKKVTAE